MRVLALDYGTKRVGLAWADTALGVALPFGVVPPDVDAVCERIKKERIEQVVVGLPVGLDGQENDNKRRVRAFAARVHERAGVPITYMDERFTSAQAGRMGGEASADETAGI